MVHKAVGVPCISKGGIYGVQGIQITSFKKVQPQTYLCLGHGIVEAAGREGNQSWNGKVCLDSARNAAKTGIVSPRDLGLVGKISGEAKGLASFEQVAVAIGDRYAGAGKPIGLCYRLQLGSNGPLGQW